MARFIVLILLVLAACSTPPAAAPPTPSVTETSSEVSSQEQAAPTQPARPLWQTLPLTNARTGETFTFADFEGQTVFVEPMATWCTNCRQQLGNVQSARGQVDSADVVFVALSVETNISAADLAEYADDHGFDWIFAVMTPDILRELTVSFGRTIANPPSTPHFILRPDGTTTALATGIESSDQIVAQLADAQG